MEKRTILIASASKKILPDLIKMLQPKYHVITSLNSGIDALEKSILNIPDLIILDSEMPNMNGYQVCRVLKNNYITKSTYIILLTSNDKFYQKFYYSLDCPDAYIPFDCDLQKLVQKIRLVLDKKIYKKSDLSSRSTKNSFDNIDIIKSLNDILDKKEFEATMFSDLTGLAQNIFSYDDLILAIIDMIPKLLNFSIAIITILSEEESKLFIHLHEDVDITIIEKIKNLTIDKCKKEIENFDISKLQIKTITEDRIKNKDGSIGLGNDTLLFSHFENGEILKKGFTFYGDANIKLDKNKEMLLIRVINEACIILENSWLYSRLYKNMKSLTITDGLTSIYNHKYIVGLVNREFSRAKRYNHKISLIMFDIDYFKEINDNFGHQTGDVVLREIATIIKKTIRESDIVGRYGGEEFAIILPETDSKEAQFIAERLRETVESYDFFNPSNPLKVTASLGVATYLSGNIDSPRTLIKFADQALYAAKMHGKNKVIACENYS